ncbi:MAG: Hsp20/alpha crystallin family protein [Candidatus Krumholzibacteriota bacterium]|nr:Hsp20/alpha crystallin family protein [Candidatus Krumholzibacteriota bacterium]
MRLVKWNPGYLHPLNRNMDDLFDGFFGVPLARERTWAPRVDVHEHEDRFELQAEIPGMEKEEISIEVQERMLAIRGEKKVEEEKDEAGCHIRERHWGRFERTFTLPENVDTAKIDAAYRNGVLTIGIPKKEEAKPKEIKVEVK